MLCCYLLSHSTDGHDHDNTVTFAEDASDCLFLTPQPTVGKKRAKLAAFNQNLHRQPTKVECAGKSKVQNKNDEQDASRARIAATAEANNLLLQQQLMFQMFM
jgi:hypothetical protein